MDTRINVQFLGGVADGENLTGSCILLTIRLEKQINRFLIDAGLIQCKFSESTKRNSEILKKISPNNLDGIIITHSHVDHIGRLPLLVKHGFGKQGRIICTEATSRLLNIMLEDSAKIQMAEAEQARERRFKETFNKKRKSSKHSYRDQMTLGVYDDIKEQIRAKHRRGKKTADFGLPLYDLEDVEHTVAVVKNGGFPYGKWNKLAKKISLKFYPSGHVLGGAICVIRIKAKKRNIYLGFSGDLGRRDGIILPPPKKITEPIDYWFTESTYGGQVHPERKDEIKKLLELVARAHANGLKIIIPSFALERSQEIVYLLSYYMSIGKIPKIPMYLDSPLAKKITDVYAASWEAGMFKGQKKLKFNPFNDSTNPYIKAIDSFEESAALVKQTGAYIVIAGSGMCDAGRVREHLREGLGNKKTVVCLVGYMADSSLGNKLQNGLPIVRMNGEEIIVESEIVKFSSFSAHADSQFLVAYALRLLHENGPKKIFIIHGEEVGAAMLKLELINAWPKNDWPAQTNITIPSLNQIVELY